MSTSSTFRRWPRSGTWPCAERRGWPRRSRSNASAPSCSGSWPRCASMRPSAPTWTRFAGGDPALTSRPGQGGSARRRFTSAPLLSRRNAGRLPRHELQPGRPLHPDGREAQRHGAILAARRHLVHRGAGDDRETAIGARRHVAVWSHLPVLGAPRAHGLDVLRLVIGGGGGVVVREVVTEQLLHRREVVRGLRGVAGSLSLHRLLGGDGSTAALSGGGADSDQSQYREHSEQSQESVCHDALLSLALERRAMSPRAPIPAWYNAVESSVKREIRGRSACPAGTVVTPSCHRSEERRVGNGGRTCLFTD